MKPYFKFGIPIKMGNNNGYNLFLNKMKID